jgi:hypothetical protein
MKATSSSHGIDSVTGLYGSHGIPARIRRILTEQSRGFAESWRDNPPALRFELRAYPFEEEVDIGLRIFIPRGDRRSFQSDFVISPNCAPVLSSIAYASPRLSARP